MKVSTKGRYGLRAMLDMALHQNEGPMAVHIVAERQGLSERYLEQLMVPLKKAGLVKSVRGPQGGYVLTKKPRDITVGEIIRALEGPIAPVDCVSEQTPEECERAEFCVTRLIWSKMRDSIAEVLDSLSLEDLIQESRKISVRSR
ncbi:MAG TPA: Rrf2 family transcriptional regulator [Syntrophothermus lipocalidus]|uniref:Transcriptional regulator, BadM/Rrf2 family n=1 Tax=Syntrophothermus lipocalidus (strain DSM 12680 / TGB-C1) TaxID=643648 RepID=D7CJX9_SYNLT|nr:MULTISPECIES: Rrf2 family transcriptional regulator [Syntrophothermus]ADI01093.1 transcriptional regulator, BadM/Rrf2 family [Syntrophothermus lipocalidus DSM 12680]NSW81773.1 Rrf2 family transcriptional regulator [Syntrophothermus sp.]HHV77261.1 Rrf2 family transcriptional regulator [Syntrophothermus lipocalidus]